MSVRIYHTVRCHIRLDSNVLHHRCRYITSRSVFYVISKSPLFALLFFTWCLTCYIIWLMITNWTFSFNSFRITSTVIATGSKKVFYLQIQPVHPLYIPYIYHHQNANSDTIDFYSNPAEVTSQTSVTTDIKFSWRNSELQFCNCLLNGEEKVSTCIL
jgi:hypothetical protein